MTPALFLALSLMFTDAPPADAPPADAAPANQGDVGEPLPAGAPTDSYELAAWCYGALDEYLGIYDKVIPDLKDMDRMFGTSVVEDKPYSADMAAARKELAMIGTSITDAEKASPKPISEQGATDIRMGRAVWSLAEAKTERELARAWMLWALPDRCDSNARELTKRSLLFGGALGFNAPPPPDAQTPDPDKTPPAGANAADPGATQTPPPAQGADQTPPPGGANVADPGTAGAPPPAAQDAPQTPAPDSTPPPAPTGGQTPPADAAPAPDPGQPPPTASAPPPAGQ